MAALKTVMIIGHSHVGCLARAAAEAELPNVKVMQLGNDRSRIQKTLSRIRTRLGRRIGRLPIRRPDAVLLCIAGNQHNVMSLLENPQPFSVGMAENGAAPNAAGRTFIPSSLMRDQIALESRLDLISDIFAMFPNAQRFYLNPPPPVSDWAHIQAHPGVFRSRLAQGPGPDLLKLQLYRLQTEVLQGAAERAGAGFIMPLDELVDARGFLAREYYNSDPTHGNLNYGNVMLHEILRQVEASS